MNYFFVSYYYTDNDGNKNFWNTVCEIESLISKDNILSKIDTEVSKLINVSNPIVLNIVSISQLVQ